MIEYDQTFDPKVEIGLGGLILWFGHFAVYLLTQWVHDHTFTNMSEYDQPFGRNVVIGHCDLISWFSDFALMGV